MIITRTWINEFIDISSISTENILKKLNSIGHEVASVIKLDLAQTIVVGKVLDCQKHPDADKLSICSVDVGSEILQIVCGAPNVAKDLFVPVAKIGTKMPSGLEIKKSKLRGIDSNGMICSSAELGLPKLNDGILPLDNSIGELILDKPIISYSKLCDEVIEVELTANRGDSLSIYGLARELSASFNLDIRYKYVEEEEEFTQGIGRVLQLTSKPNITSSHVYKIFETQTVKSPLLIDIRLGFIGEEKKTSIEKILHYATYATGVVLRGYNLDKLANNSCEKAEIEVIRKNEQNLLTSNNAVISIVGISQEESIKCDEETKNVLIEASYVNPNELTKIVQDEKLKTDSLYYRTSRGSEPALDLGIQYFRNELEKYSSVEFYSQKLQVVIDKEPISININLDSVNALIGMKIDKNKIVSILKTLGMVVHVNSDQDNLIVDVPKFRHDILNQADITEEIVRIIGIDNINIKPMEFVENRNTSETYLKYKQERNFANKAVSAGFYESLHFLFCDEIKATQFGYEKIDESLSLLNPITSDLNTLRPTLLINLLAGVKLNLNKSRNLVGLFEIGDVFNSKREQSRKIAFVYSGDSEKSKLKNRGKSTKIDFGSFCEKISSVIGDFVVKNCDESKSFLHPGQSGILFKDQKIIGYMGKLHPKIQSNLELFDTFVCELDLNQLELKTICAKNFSKFQTVRRDLSLIIDQNITFESIKEEITALNIDSLKDIFVIDRYQDEKLGTNVSLTIRFLLQSMEKTLQEDEISSSMNKILNLLNDSFKATLR